MLLVKAGVASADSGAAAMAACHRGSIPGCQQRAKMDCISAPPRRAARSAVPEAIPGFGHRHRTRQRTAGRCARQAHAKTHESVPQADLPIWDTFLPEQEHGHKTEQNK